MRPAVKGSDRRQDWLKEARSLGSPLHGLEFPCQPHLASVIIHDPFAVISSTSASPRSTSPL